MYYYLNKVTSDEILQDITKTVVYFDMQVPAAASAGGWPHIYVVGDKCKKFETVMPTLDHIMNLLNTKVMALPQHSTNISALMGTVHNILVLLHACSAHINNHECKPYRRLGVGYNWYQELEIYYNDIHYHCNALNNTTTMDASKDNELCYRLLELL